ncbi:MAG: hypothetical protein C0604_04355, partial [Clostridiales bacterium]
MKKGFTEGHIDSMGGFAMNDNRIVLKDDRKKAMISQIKKFFMEERDEDLGDLGAQLILD